MSEIYELPEIWIEGYAVTGNSSGAQFIGKSFGNTFEEACVNFKYPLDTKDYYGKTAEWVGQPLKLDKDKDGSFTYERPSIWACRLYDNEADARKSFG